MFIEIAESQVVYVITGDLCVEVREEVVSFLCIIESSLRPETV